MRLYQITEAISLTKLQKPLIDAFNKGIINAAKLVGQDKRNVDVYMKNEAIREGTLSKLAPYTEKWYKAHLEKDLRYLFGKIISEELGTDTSVSFETMKPNGYAAGVHIALNEKNLTFIVDKVTTYVYQKTLDSIEGESQIFDMYFKMFKDFNDEDLDQIYLNSRINDVVSTLIHEAVHVAQHQTQFDKGRSSTEYRSYLEKDKKKFYRGVDKMHDQTSDISNQEYEAYLASPQEINARSHQAALEFLKDSFDNEMSVEEIRSSLSTVLPGYIERNFQQPDDKQRYAIYKRFTKQVYQEVIRELERLEKNTPK